MNKNFLYVMAGLVLGIVLGVASYYSFPDKATAFEVAKYMSLISTIFLKLIKMIIGPLVFSTLVIVIADQSATTANLSTAAFSIENFIDHVVPTSIFKALADGEILQIVVFSIFAGVALVALGERGEPRLRLA